MSKPRRTLKKDLECVIERLHRAKGLSGTEGAEAQLFWELWLRATQRGDYERQRYEEIIHPIDRGEAHT